MPETTPIYSFPYPCHGDLVSVADFQNLANAIDTKLQDVQGHVDWATGRYNFSQFAGTQAGVAAGVDTVIALAGAQYVVPVNGVWLFTYDVRMLAAGTVSSSRLRVRRNAVVQYGQRQNNANATPVEFHVPPCPLICAAGDVISSTFLYTGTVTGDVSVYFAGRLLIRLA